MSDASLWSSYIQINIYGRKLRDLDQEGVDVGQFLKLNGCGKFWMGEVPMMNSDSDSGLDSSGEEDLEMVETTQMIDGTKLLSTTVADVKFPPCSTPLISKRWPSFNMTTSRISNIDDVGFDIEDHSLNLNNPKRSEFEDIAREVLEGVVQKLERENHSSAISPRFERAPRLFCSKTVLLPPSRRVPIARASLPLKQTFFKSSPSSTIKRRPTLKAVERKSTYLHGINATLPRVHQQLAEVQDDLHYSNHTLPENGEHSPTPLLPLVFSETTEYGWHDDNGDQFHSFDEDDATVPINHDDSFPRQRPPSPNVIQLRTKTIIRKSAVNLQPMKRVSLKVTRKRKGSRYRQINELHKISCKFQNCGRFINWNVKYGKLRLIDHALTHCTEANLSCRACNFKSITVRRMRLHYQKAHDGERMEGFGMLNMPLGKMEMSTLWKTCFGDHLDIIGEIGSRGKKKRIPRLVQDHEVEEGKSEGPA